MSVNPGFGGQSFIPSSYAKVRQVKSLLGRRPIEISVDGGVNRDKAGPLAQAGADVLYPALGQPRRTVKGAELVGLRYDGPFEVVVLRQSASLVGGHRPPRGQE